MGQGSKEWWLGVWSWEQNGEGGREGRVQSNLIVAEWIVTACCTALRLINYICHNNICIYHNTICICQNNICICDNNICIGGNNLCISTTTFVFTTVIFVFAKTISVPLTNK